MIINFLDSHSMSLNDDLDFSPLEKLGVYNAHSITNDDDIVSFSKDSEIIITNKIEIDNKIIESLPKLGLICVIATGYNVVDVVAAARKNIPVLNVPNYAQHSVSQHTFALILALASKICSYRSDVKKGKWQKSDSFSLLSYPTFELAGKTMGIIGFGAIGRKTAQIARSFDMEVVASDISDTEKYGYKNSTLDEVLKASDILSVHIPLTPDTKDLITRKELKKMKPNAYIINTSRGGIINEEDLAWALNEDVIAGAGIDVLTKEPPTEGNPLLADIKNIIVTPHVAWSSKEARQRLIDITAENIKSFLRGDIKNRVN